MLENVFHGLAMWNVAFRCTLSEDVPLVALVGMEEKDELLLYELPAQQVG